jgi:hypothetical protein
MSQKKYASLQTLQTFLTNLRSIFAERSHEHNINDIADYVVDEELSAISTNPVQNKIIDAEFEAVATALNALDIVIGNKTDLEALRATTESIKAWAESKFINSNHGVDNADKVLSVSANGTVVPTANIVYVGPTEPEDPDVKVWINTSEEGVSVVPVLPRITTITLSADGWAGSSELYSQQVEIATVTAASKIDLQPNAQQIVDLQNAEISLMVENNGGVVTCYAIGNKPTVDYTMQVLIQEVSYV